MNQRTVEGRPTVEALVDGVARDLVVDSGADILVLFENVNKVRISAGATLFANGQSAAEELGSAWVGLGDGRKRQMTASRVNTPELSGGLLPANGFRAIYVSNREGFVEMVR
jgi:hypothetical protein